jgi:excisionase family DNA binding protein
MVQQRTVEERLQMIEEYLLEIKSMLRPASISKQQTSEQETLISVKDVAKLVKCDSAVVYAACKRNELPYIRLGKLYKFRKAEVLQWMTSQKHSADNLVDDYVNKYLQKHLLKG